MEHESYNRPRVVQKTKVVNNAWGGMYGLGFIGALVYFIQHATSFWIGVIGVLKAVFWPAVLIYKVFERLAV